MTPIIYTTTSLSELNIVFVASMLADGLNACVEGNKHTLAKMFAKLILHDPSLLLMINEAVDLATAEIDNKLTPELN